MNDWKNGVSEIVVSAGVQAEECPQIPREKKPVEPTVKQPLTVEKQYRAVTVDDIGKIVEVRDDNNQEWSPSTLEQVLERKDGPYAAGWRFCAANAVWKQARIEVTEPVEPVVKQSLTPEKRYRDVTEDDIGKTIEVRDYEDSEWCTRKLVQISDLWWERYKAQATDQSIAIGWNQARIEVTEPVESVVKQSLTTGELKVGDIVRVGFEVEKVDGNSVLVWSIDGQFRGWVSRGRCEKVENPTIRKRFRDVTEADIGKTIEVSDYGDKWDSTLFAGFLDKDDTYYKAGFRFQGLYSVWKHARIEVIDPVETPKLQCGKFKICDEVRVIEPTHEFFGAHGQIDDVLGDDQYLFRSDCGLEIGSLHVSELKKDESLYGEDWRAATKDDIGRYIWLGDFISGVYYCRELVAVLPEQVTRRYVVMSYDQSKIEPWPFAKVEKEKYRYCLWRMDLKEGTEIEVRVKKRWIKAKLIAILGEKYARRFVFTTDGSNTQLASQARIKV